MEKIMADEPKPTNQPKSQLAEIEEMILATWEQEKTFEQSLKLREGQERFSFYDGPPFANGLPHFGHSLVTSIKDSLGRYKTMRGYYVERRNGWDCHGLPVEFAIEKQFGVSGKKQIMELGLEKFNAACRESVFAYKSEWEQFFGRMGRWTDTEHAYATIDTSYTESVWWVISEVHKKGLLYRGYKSMPYCPRCETPLSNFEVNEGYRDNVPDPSLYVKFKLEDEDASLLGWTTTPWSLPGNGALAVRSDEVYTYARVGEEVLVVAKKRLRDVFKNETKYEVLREVKGSELVGKRYQPPFQLDRYIESTSEPMYRVYAADFVTVEDGTGVLHVAPAFGEDDLSLGEREGLDILSTVDASGKLTDGIGLNEVKGKFFKGADRPIIEHLTEKGLVFAAETFEHTYPFCYRCESPLLYYAISTWFIKVSAIKEQLLAAAETINWTPDHIKDGRFGKWLEGARDWAISRNRYWGAPMPIWVNQDDPKDYLVISSVAELAELSGTERLDDLHRPGIDQVVIEKDGKTYRRVEEVLDCWVESGAMPVAQNHYPFENKDKFEVSFPADYINEGLDQTRLWFYVLHVLSTILFDKPAYKNVLVSGMIMATDGQKLSKRLKNYPPVEDVFGQEGADSLRLYLLSNHQAVSADYMRFDRGAMKDINQNVLGTLMNSYRFFEMYARIDKWQPGKPGETPESTNVLDQWILTRLNQAIEDVTKAADAYKLAHAINPIFALIDDMSNWYIRRSRRRFWKSEDDRDKQMAYETLWFVLLRTSQLLAPWAPFLSDHIWRQLVTGTDLPTSVHLSDWPTSEVVAEGNQSLVDMAYVRGAVALGLSKRAEGNIKVRQPLNTITILNALKDDSNLSAYTEVIQEELNVKNVIVKRAGDIDSAERQKVLQDPGYASQDGGSVEIVLDLAITDELKREGLMREVVRHVQSARKSAGLNVEDRIQLTLASEDQVLRDAIEEHRDTIAAETLATQLSLQTHLPEGQTGLSTVSIEGAQLAIAIEKSVA
jgi:isoleucyl-tRNA synthetase